MGGGGGDHGGGFGGLGMGDRGGGGVGGGGSGGGAPGGCTLPMLLLDAAGCLARGRAANKQTCRRGVKRILAL